MEVNYITSVIIDKCIRIHREIGPGCFEKVYEELLYHELSEHGFTVERQKPFPILYNGLVIKDAYKLDLLVEDAVIIEVKSVENLHAVHFKQLMTYLKLLNIKNGLLLNFKVALMKEGINRVFNNTGV